MKTFQFRIAKKNLPSSAEININSQRTIFTASTKDNVTWIVTWTSSINGKQSSQSYRSPQVLKYLADRDWILVDDGDTE
ncbi:hypothetical protein PQE70_gp147 [Bacillus phage vB_BanS_Nate]|uniref:Uncharacterized protein n=1 Tax=Bacillus phage vB_BanS_Nate TaxID=2894788 RepID=A0AAE9CDQ7_9CAUD|nr:hypothetical protein PQE70_gp147 [Bacillus phage vB_BanS_Nate]UGO51000.1 hypothetical protein NATE_147 [Bacillus phage vB_BanS_Nate]